MLYHCNASILTKKEYDSKYNKTINNKNNRSNYGGSRGGRGGYGGYRGGRGGYGGYGGGRGGYGGGRGGYGGYGGGYGGYGGGSGAHGGYGGYHGRNYRHNYTQYHPTNPTYCPNNNNQYRASHSQSKERTSLPRIGYDNLLHGKKFNSCGIFLFPAQKYHGIWMKSAGPNPFLCIVFD